MARTDPHSPKNLRTEDYEFVACGWFPTSQVPGYSPIGPNGSARHLLDEGWTFGENSSAGVCYHCGQSNIVFYAILKHLPTHRLIRIGEQCLENRFERATREFHALRKRRALNREEITKAERRRGFDEAHPEVVADLQRAKDTARDQYDWEQSFMGSLFQQLERKGELSVAQVDAVYRGIAKRKAREAERAEERKNEPAPSPVVIGRRVEITGKIVSVKMKSTVYGDRLVMTVLDDRGFKVWGSVPSNIGTPERGTRIAFVAGEVTASDRDEAFGFFKRPTRAQVDTVQAA